MPSDFNIQQILHGDPAQANAQLGSLFTAASAGAPAAALRRNTAEKLCAYLFKNGFLDTILNAQLAELQTAFIAQAEREDSFYSNAAHPFRQLFEFMLQRVRVWYPRDSKLSQTFYEKLTVLIQQTIQWAHPISSNATQLENKTADWQKIFTEFQTWSDSEDKRAAMLEKRLCETEISNLKMLTAECQVLDVINASLAGKLLPNAILEEIPTALKNELQHFAFTTGTSSTFWKLWHRILPIIARVFTPGDMKEQQLYRDIPVVLNELDRSLKLISGNATHYHELVDNLSNSLMLAIQKQTQECQPLTALPYPNGHSGLHTQVIDSVLQQATSIQEGGWILFSGENDQNIRCKLALKNIDSDQLLFVDNTGRKVMIKNSKDFSLCISTGIAKPLTAIKLDDAITKLIHPLIELSQQKSAQLQVYLDAEKSKAEAEIEQQRQAEQQKLEEIKILQQRLFEQQAANRRAAAHKAMAEARALAEEKARRDAELALARHAERVRQQADNERQQFENETEKNQRALIAVDHIKSLNVGAWIEINSPEQQGSAAQQILRCKLAVVIGAAGKYIFVDNLGRKVAEYQREQLIQAYIDNSLTLLNNGDRFEDQLVKVIRSLRKDIS